MLPEQGRSNGSVAVYFLENHTKNKKQLKGLIKSAKVILQLVKSKKLKLRLAFTLNKGIFLANKFIKNKQVNLGILDYLLIFLYSVWQFIMIRKRTITKEGL